MTVVEHPAVLSLASIRIDGGTQPRAQMDMMYVAELAQAILDGAHVPAIITFYDGADYWLADGFHRYHAFLQLDRKTIYVEVRQGTRRDAVLFSVGANATHGLRRTNTDKRRAVETLLNDPEWAVWSNNEIARRCATSLDLVNRMRNDNSLNESLSEPRTYINKYGNVATMNTTNIGHGIPWQFSHEGKEEDKSLYDGSKPAYCKYCYETHTDWELSGNHDGTVWICQRCDHAMRDEFMQIEDEAADEQSAMEEVESAGRVLQQAIGLKQAELDQRIASLRRNALAALQSSESNEWYTPKAYVDAAHELMGSIDLDPASNSFANRIVQAIGYFDIAQNGLEREWYGRVWLNPPYGFTNGRSNQELWTQRLIEQFTKEFTTEAILLVNANTEAKWFQPLYDHLICFTDHRIHFYNQASESSQPTQGNALVYFGHQRERFIEIFSRFGTVIERAK